MKKLLWKGGLALIGAMLVFAFAGCPSETEPSPGPGPGRTAFLTEFTVRVESNDQEVTATIGLPISAPELEEMLDEGENAGDFEDGVLGTLDFPAAEPPVLGIRIGVYFSSVQVSGTATYIVKAGNTLPNEDFDDLEDVDDEELVQLDNNVVVYFKVVNGSSVNWYGFRVSTAAAPSSNANFTGSVTVGGANPRSFAQMGATGSETAAGAKENKGSLELPVSNATGTVNMTFNRSQNQTYEFAVTAEDAGAPATFTAAAVNGNAVTAELGTAGVSDGQVVYLKVTAQDGITVQYYAFSIGMGNVAELTGITFTAGSETDTVIAFGTAMSTFGPWTPANPSRPGTPGGTSPWGAPDVQIKQPAAGFSITLTAAEGCTVSYVHSGNVLTTEPAGWDNPATQYFNNGDYLFVKVVSHNGKVTVYYRVQIIVKNIVLIEYGQPAINYDSEDLDPLWETIDWNLDISRINLMEMAPTFKFLNTVDPSKNHTEGKAKAFWDDNGIYVYAEMSFTDYYEDAAAQTAGTSTARVTAVSPGTTGAGSVADNNAHNSDSLEYFLNLRYQQYKNGNYGDQFRVAPANAAGYAQSQPGSMSRVSGNAVLGNIPTFRSNGRYYSWIRYEDTKDVGYSIIAFIPWQGKNQNYTDQVFGSDGKVLADANGTEGPDIGFELQLNTNTSAAVTTGTNRDSILTWNGINGQSYQECRNYGIATLILGDLNGKGITRGERDIRWTAAATATAITLSFTGEVDLGETDVTITAWGATGAGAAAIDSIEVGKDADDEDDNTKWIINLRDVTAGNVTVSIDLDGVETTKKIVAIPE